MAKQIDLNEGITLVDFPAREAHESSTDEPAVQSSSHEIPLHFNKLTATETAELEPVCDAKITDSNGDSKDAAKTNNDIPIVSMRSMYRYATGFDILILVIGAIGAAGVGLAWPMWSFLFSNSINKFASNADVVGAVSEVCIGFLYLGAGVGVASGIRTVAFRYLSTKQMLRVKQEYFRAIFRQEPAFFDAENTASISSRFSSHIPKMQAAYDDKFGEVLRSISMCVSGLVIAFNADPILALTILAFLPSLTFGHAFVGKILARSSALESRAYAGGAAVSAEDISLIRTIMVFCTQQYEKLRYKREVDRTYQAQRKFYVYESFTASFPYLFMFCLYAFAFGYGSSLVRSGKIDGGVVVRVLLAVIMAGSGFGMAIPLSNAVRGARVAAYEVFALIDRKSALDPTDQTGDKLDHIEGTISFKNVSFAYPTRSEDIILNGMNLTIPARKTLALVGPSGGGKSTVMAMVLRLYDPTEGVVQVDGRPLTSLQLGWYRDQIAVVEQSTTLFSGTILDNIALGKPGATREQVIEAAKQANAHDFISAFPLGYDTEVGDSGAQLSGGQRQRLAIARAMIRNPSILLLDEATSALDHHTEKLVQTALNQVSQNRTTVVIAHRLSTIRHADSIAFIRGGRVIEQGSHEELVAMQGSYYALLKASGAHHHETAGEKSDDDSESSSDTEEAGKTTKTEGPSTRKTSVVVASESDELLTASFLRKWAWTVSKPFKHLIILSLIFAIFEGAVWPMNSVIFAQASSIVIQPNHSVFEIAMWSGAFALLGVYNIFTSFLRSYFCALAGAHLTRELRMRVFSFILQQPASYFDDKNHTQGILTNYLTQDAANVRNVLGDFISVALLVMATLVIGVVVALSSCYRLALVILACIPLVVSASAIGRKVSFRKESAESKRAASLASSTVQNARSIISLGIFPKFERDYANYITALAKDEDATVWPVALLSIILQFVTMGIWALAFYYGSTLVDQGECDTAHVFRAMTNILFSALMAGVYAATLPEAGPAIKSATNIYNLLHGKQSLEAVNSAEPKTPVINGVIEFRNVSFNYPARPDAVVLDGVSFVVPQGKTCAFVGSSGSGKSTIISLLEQFYKPVSGQILIDGVDLNDINLDHFRQHVALVAQEPKLFNLSIKENILYGLPEGSSPTQDQVRQAALKANAATFIEQLPNTYATSVGEFGGQLSGGQRQRVAISRVFMREQQIRIALFDEATSALDSQSEKLVMESLERARIGRTTLIVAHRLSTIRDADIIFVLNQGRIAEQGTHDSLIASKGLYYDLVSQQMGTTN